MLSPSCLPKRIPSRNSRNRLLISFVGTFAIKVITEVRWPTTVTSKQNAHIKFKSLTANSNHWRQIKTYSQQIQIAHSKLQIVHIKCKSFTSNTNRSHQIQIAHSKYKSLTANTNTVSVKRRLRTADCGLQTADQGKKHTEGKMQTAD